MPSLSSELATDRPFQSHLIGFLEHSSIYKSTFPGSAVRSLPVLRFAFPRFCGSIFCSSAVLRFAFRRFYGSLF